MSFLVGRTSQLAGPSGSAIFRCQVLRLSDLLHSVHPSKCCGLYSTVKNKIPDSAPNLPTRALGTVELAPVPVRPGCSSPARTHTLSQQADGH